MRGCHPMVRSKSAAEIVLLDLIIEESAKYSSFRGIWHFVIHRVIRTSWSER
jgi:hypothetical protein